MTNDVLPHIFSGVLASYRPQQMEMYNRKEVIYRVTNVTDRGEKKEETGCVVLGPL